MIRIGQVLAILGVIIGALASLALALPVQLSGLSWLIAVGLVKMTFASSLGLIGTGAILQRIAKRNAERARLSAPREP